MRFDDLLRASRTSPAVAFDRFIRRYTRPGFLHLFFEGPDDPSFYMGFIEHRYIPPQRVEEPYICKGKNGVYETYEKVMKRLSGEPEIANRIKVLFFVDKDHSDIDGKVYPLSDVIFTTDFYSIENYVVSSDMFRKVWNEYYHFQGTGTDSIPDYLSFQSLFNDQLKVFYNLMIPVMAWIIVARRKGGNPQLKQLDLDNIFRLNDDLQIEMRVVRKYTSQRDALERMCNASMAYDIHADIDATILILEQIEEPKKFVRGKFEVWFFSKFVKKLAEKFYAQSDIPFKFRNETQVEEEQFLHAFGYRTPIPNSLQVFLERHLLHFPEESQSVANPKLL